MADLNKPLDLNQVNDYLTSLMVLQKAEANNELDPYFKGIANQLGETTAKNPPFDMISKAFSAENALDIKLQYADYWEQIHGQVKAVDMSSKLAVAGYSADEIDSIPPEMVQHFATVDVFQEHFPSKDKEDSLMARLANGKDALFDALNSEGGKKAMTAISLGISIGTGAIVTRMALRGGAYIASQIIQNESVQDFASKMQHRVGGYLERMGVPTSVIGKKFLDFKENAKAVLASDAFQRYGKPSLALAGIAMGALMLGEVNHEKVIDLATNGFNKTVDLASAGVELGAQGAHVANDTIKSMAESIIETGGKAAVFVVDASSSAVDSVAQFGHEAAVAIEGGVRSSVEFVADTAVGAVHAAGTGVIVGGQALVHGVEAGAELVTAASGQALDALHSAGAYAAEAVSSGYDTVHDAAVAATDSTVEAANSATQYVAETASSAYDATANGLAGAVDSTRHFVGDGLHSLGDHVRGAGDMVAGTEVHAPADTIASANIDSSNSTADQILGDRKEMTDVVAPDATVDVPNNPAGSSAQTDTHVIQKHESLWKIAENEFHENGVNPTQGQIQVAAKALYEANKDSIGADWNLIHEGKSLNINPELFAVHHAADTHVVATAVAPSTPTNDLDVLSKMLGNQSSFPSNLVMSDDQAHKMLMDAGIGSHHDAYAGADANSAIAGRNTMADSEVVSHVATEKHGALQDRVSQLLHSDSALPVNKASWKAAVDKIYEADVTPSPGS
jgi:LysM repeat protein